MSDTRPVRLRTVPPTPLAVDPGELRFRWQAPGGMASQSAYHVRVATDPEALFDGRVVWDSGVVERAVADGVDYAGPPLPPRTRYHWSVRLRGGGSWSDWSVPAAFETAPEELRGEWVAPTGPAYETSPAPAPAFRTAFDLEASVDRARLHVAAGGTCDPRLNGTRVTERALDPARTDYGERVLAATYEVTDELSVGENALALVCGREQYAMTTETVWGWHDPPWGREHPEVCAELAVTLADGTERTVGTDGTWRVAPSATQFDSLYAGEAYDAREATTYSDPDAVDGTWSRARPVGGPAGEVVPQGCPPVEPVRTVTPEGVSEPEDGVYVVDFGEMVAGWTRLSAAAPAGTTVGLAHGEKLDERGTVDVASDHVDSPLQTDRYTFAGDGRETWEPRFSYRGFRYVQVDGLPDPPGDDTLTAVVAHTTVEAGSKSEFACSEPLLEAIHDNTRRALLNNLHGVPTDTPVYEKNGWTGDAQLSAEAAVYEFEMAAFFRKWLADFADAQRDTGELPPIVPTSDWGYSDAPHGGDITSPNPAWDAAYVLIAWWLYRYCGDRSVLRDHYDGMTALANFLAGYLDGGVCEAGLGDWLAPGHEAGVRPHPPEGAAIASTAYYYRIVDVLADIAAVLGHDADAAAFADRRSEVANAFNDRFLDAEAGVYSTGRVDEYRQTSNVLPLAFGIVPGQHRESVLDGLVDDIRNSQKSHLDTGILGTKHLLPVLTEAGHVDLAYTVATRTSYPGWGHWITAGATSLYEAWELDARSRNHHMFGSIVEWFYRYLAGVRPSDPGFRAVAVEPHVPADLDRVSAVVDTVRGPVDVDWRTANGEFRCELTLPPATEGTLRPPGTDPVLEASPDRESATERRPDRTGEREAIPLSSGSWTVRTLL